MLLKQNFPNIPFYYPLWNAGIDARDFFATGTLNVFFLASPLLYSLNLPENYNLIIAYILFLIVPLVIYLAARMQALPRPVPAIASILALSLSLLWYRWALKYGTMGFITTASIIPLNLVLATKILSKDQQITFAQAVLTVVSFTLMLFWSPSGLVFIPIIIVALFKLPSILRKKYTLFIVLALLTINIPWITLFWSVSNVSKFMQSEESVKQASTKPDPGKEMIDPRGKKYRHKAAALDIRKSIKILRTSAVSTNPLLLLFGIPGLFLLKRSRILLLVTAIWLIFLGSVMVPIKPQLELDRMLTILALVLCLPSALAIQRMFNNAQSSKQINHKLLAAVCGGFLFVGPLCSAGIILNRSVEQYHFAKPIVANISKAIEQFAGDGRTLFSGCIVHDLDGHLAPLTEITGKPMIASSQVHNLWWYTQVFPREYIARKWSGGIEEYLDLLNVSVVVAHEPEWRHYFLQQPEKYELQWKEGRFKLFTRHNFVSDYFLEGQGEILSQDVNALRLKLKTKDAVIKFKYLDFLQSTACDINKHEVSENVKFIKLTNCPIEKQIRIWSNPPYRRVFH